MLWGLWAMGSTLEALGEALADLGFELMSLALIGWKRGRE